MKPYSVAFLKQSKYFYLAILKYIDRFQSIVPTTY